MTKLLLESETFGPKTVLLDNEMNSPEKSFDCEACCDLGELTVMGKNGKSRLVTCKDCCPHDDIYKYMCTSCDKEFNPTDFINEDAWRD